MNNQMPYGFIPQFGGNQNQGCQCNNQLRSFNERIQNLERQIRRLERRVTNLESNGFIRPLPISSVNNEEQFQDNYMI